MSYRRLRQAEAKLAAEVAGWFAGAEQSDAMEDSQNGSERRGDEPPDWLADKAKRLARIRAARVALEREAAEDPF
jgi:hypothetical protein